MRKSNRARIQALEDAVNATNEKWEYPDGTIKKKGTLQAQIIQVHQAVFGPSEGGGTRARLNKIEDAAKPKCSECGQIHRDAHAHIFGHSHAKGATRPRSREEHAQMHYNGIEHGHDPVPEDVGEPPSAEDMAPSTESFLRKWVRQSRTEDAKDTEEFLRDCKKLGADLAARHHKDLMAAVRMATSPGPPGPFAAGNEDDPPTEEVADAKEFFDKLVGTPGEQKDVEVPSEPPRRWCPLCHTRATKEEVDRTWCWHDLDGTGARKPGRWSICPECWLVGRRKAGEYMHRCPGCDKRATTDVAHKTWRLGDVDRGGYSIALELFCLDCRDRWNCGPGGLPGVDYPVPVPPVKPLKEGSVKKGGIKPEPTTLKPDIEPMADRPVRDRTPLRAPGEDLASVMNEAGNVASGVDVHFGWEAGTTSRMLEGLEVITPTRAEQLSSIFPITPLAWLQAEARYRSGIAHEYLETMIGPTPRDPWR